MNANGQILVMVDDMFFAAKILGAANLAAREVRRVVSAPELEQALAENAVGLLIVDLNGRQFDGVRTVSYLKSRDEFRDIPVIGFLSHVQADLKRAAVGAGCDYVVPRSMFSTLLPRILAGDYSSLPSSAAADRS